MLSKVNIIKWILGFANVIFGILIQRQAFIVKDANSL